MGTTLSAVGRAPALSGAADLSLVPEFAAELPLAAGALLLMPTPAGGSLQTGGVAGDPTLTWERHSDETQVALIRHDADGAAHEVRTLTMGADGGLYDGTLEAGRIDANGTATLTGAAATPRTDDRACRADPPDGPPVRNAGLPPALQSSSTTARMTTYLTDPKLAQAGLTMFGPSGPDCAQWRAHHLIPIQQISDHRDLFEAAAQDGWSADEANNLMGLPFNQAAQTRLAGVDAPRPIHDNAHQTNYSAQVKKDLEEIKSTLADSHLQPGTRAYNHLAHDLIEQEEQKMRGDVEAHGVGRLTMNEATTGSEQAA